MILAKLVDNLMAAEQKLNDENVICDYNNKFELGSVPSYFRKMHFFGLTIEQAGDFIINTDADEKLT